MPHACNAKAAVCAYAVALGYVCLLIAMVCYPVSKHSVMLASRARLTTVVLLTHGINPLGIWLWCYWHIAMMHSLMLPAVCVTFGCSQHSGAGGSHQTCRGKDAQAARPCSSLQAISADYTNVVSRHQHIHKKACCLRAPRQVYSLGRASACWLCSPKCFYAAVPTTGRVSR